MNNWNLLILTVYIVSVVYVFYRAIKSVDNQLTLQLDRNYLNQQLEAQGIKSFINIQFKLQDRYQTDNLHELSIIIENKSETSSIIVDWDQSSLTDFEERSRRVIRLIPGMTLDLFQPQVFSVIAPKQILKERLTAEDILKRNSSGVLEISSTLFNPKRLEKASEKNDYFLLAIMIKLSDKTKSSSKYYTLSCQFRVNKLPWTEALGHNPKPFHKD